MPEETRRHSPGSRTPKDVSRGLHEFTISDRLLLSPKDMHDYAGQWVAAHEGKIVAVGADLNTVMGLLRADGIPTELVAIRFIKEGGMAAA